MKKPKNRQLNEPYPLGQALTDIRDIALQALGADEINYLEALNGLDLIEYVFGVASDDPVAIQHLGVVRLEVEAWVKRNRLRRRLERGQIDLFDG